LKSLDIFRKFAR